MDKVEIGNATLYCGDCLEVLADLPAASVEAVVTDPPYGIGFLSPRTKNHRKLVADEFGEWRGQLPRWLPEMARVLTNDGCCCCCCCGGGKTPVTALFTVEFIKHFRLIQIVVWDKQTIGLGWRYRPAYETIVIGSKDADKYRWCTERKDISNIIRCGNIIPQKGDHPTVKPVPLMKHFIDLHTEAGAVVLDPFMGSGTTGVAASEMGRKFIGIEIDPAYFDTACKRIDAAQRQGKLAI